MTDISTHQASSPGVGRRAVLGGAAALAALGPLQALGARTAGAAPMSRKPFSTDYGPLAPVRDETTGLPLLMLPQGFRYISYGWTGDLMDDGKATPGAHDGMATFEGSGPGNGRGRGKTDQIDLVRNHEQGSFRPAFTEPAYNPNANGGTTNLAFDPRGGRWLSSAASLSGTIRNCAGGPTPQGSWLTCEETTATGPDGTPHGYIFEVPAGVGALGDPAPYKLMGRFSHEAVCVDPSTGIVYETEDAQPSGFYRFRPNNPNSLSAGGRLEMLKITSTTDTSVITYDDATGTEYRTEWVAIDEPDPAAGVPSTVQQGIAKGGAQFARLEGAWWHEGKAYIVSTSGGPIGRGQVFEYDPEAESMNVLFASTDAEVLRSPDNICVSPRDGIVLCQDGGDEAQRMFGLTMEGEVFDFARNNVVIDGPVPGKPQIAPGDYRDNEWCGSTFDRRGDWLFANIQTPGITFAITGPWDRGSL